MSPRFWRDISSSGVSYTPPTINIPTLFLNTSLLPFEIHLHANSSSENPVNTGSSVTVEVCLTHSQKSGATSEVQCCQSNPHFWTAQIEKQKVDDIGETELLHKTQPCAVLILPARSVPRSEIVPDILERHNVLAHSARSGALGWRGCLHLLPLDSLLDLQALWPEGSCGWLL